ncbi:MAG: cytochrome ubiquinol oxidase subunit I [Thermodesulfobacteriota bacterium]
MMKVFEKTGRWRLFLAGGGLLVSAVLFYLISPVLALEASAKAQEAVEYRTFLGINPRSAIWVIAQVHLMFGAFVLGVPIFAVLIEYVGYLTSDERYDKMAKDFIRLLSATFAITAALGGLLTFSLFSLYPKVMEFITGIYHDMFIIYALCFFVETFTLYFYYYSWANMKKGKAKLIHVLIGVWLNIIGLIIMILINALVAFMMIPTGIDKETGQFVGTLWEALFPVLQMPFVIHRILGNILFGGLVAAAYAAVKFLLSKSDEERAHYDWMGYTGNFVATTALVFLSFAGYNLGREIYSASPVMGNNMMGGAFSWTFIIQGIGIGGLLLISNWYLWMGMGRIPGAERYQGYVKYLLMILLLCFGIWLTPHNLPLAPEEQIMMGGTFHPTLKFFGLMPAKNAAINFMILSTFFSFLLYRRAGVKSAPPVAEQSNWRKILLIAAGVFAVYLTAIYYGTYLFALTGEEIGLAAEKARYFKIPAYLLFGQGAVVILAIILTFMNYGKIGQAVLFAYTVFNVVGVLGIYGYVVMAEANPFLKQIAAAQWLSLLSCLITTGFIDILIFGKAKTVGEMQWGKMPPISQYVLIALSMIAVFTMGVMGFVRSGLREDWHIYGVLRDTSQWAFTPSNFYATKIVALCTLLFYFGAGFVFWLSDWAETKTKEAE